MAHHLSSDDSRLLVCENCGQVLAGQWTDHANLVPLGTRDCRICGHRQFKQISFPDLGPKQGSHP